MGGRETKTCVLRITSFPLTDPQYGGNGPTGIRMLAFLGGCLMFLNGGLGLFGVFSNPLHAVIELYTCVGGMVPAPPDRQFFISPPRIRIPLLTASSVSRCGDRNH